MGSKRKMSSKRRMGSKRRMSKKVRSKRNPVRKKKSRSVSKILSSTYSIGNLANIMNEPQKGYKVQRVAKKDPYKKKKHPPIPSNIKGKKKKPVSNQSGMDSFLAGIKSKSSKKSQPKMGWVSHVKKVWEEGKKKDKDYKYKDAMKDAKNTW
tara:strand:+ start:453 stop:908 length:456 start_codon:yes stop_codon:yes gene_type:complete